MIATSLVVTGCRSESFLDSTGQTSTGSRSPNDAVAPYAHAPWRLLPWNERGRIVLWVSHILISHRDARGEPSLRPVGWAPDAPPERSRADAQKLAIDVARQAGAHPGSFEALARQYSDDEVTRGAGGSLGGVRSTQLPSAFLDALTVLQPGEVSRVVETTFGFHILLRRSPPPQEDVEGRRVVIRYAGTLSSINESTSDRARKDASDLANTVAALAKGATPFTDLVSRYSEDADRECEGDIGVWSTLAPGDKPREIETLSRLKVGEVSAPVDSLWGFQVLQRVEPSKRGRYSMAAIRLKYGPTLPAEDPRSRPSAFAQASSLARRLHRAPSTLEEARAEQDDHPVETWEWGHGAPQLTLAIERLHFGEVAAEPVAIPFFFVVPMRLDPALTPDRAPPPLYELPLRMTPDIERLFHDGDRKALAARIADIMRPEVTTALGLTDTERVAFRSTLEGLRNDLQGAATAEARVRGYRVAIKRLQERVPEAIYSKLMGFFEQEAARIVLTNP